VVEMRMKILFTYPLMKNEPLRMKSGKRQGRRYQDELFTCFIWNRCFSFCVRQQIKKMKN
jgi:hypothetical protein